LGSDRVLTLIWRSNEVKREGWGEKPHGSPRPQFAARRILRNFTGAQFTSRTTHCSTGFRARQRKWLCALSKMEKHCRIDTRGDWNMATFLESRPRTRSQIEPRTAVARLSQTAHHGAIALNAPFFESLTSKKSIQSSQFTLVIVAGCSIKLAETLICSRWKAMKQKSNSFPSLHCGHRLNQE